MLTASEEIWRLTFLCIAVSNWQHGTGSLGVELTFLGWRVCFTLLLSIFSKYLKFSFSVLPTIADVFWVFYEMSLTKCLYLFWKWNKNTGSRICPSTPVILTILYITYCLTFSRIHPVHTTYTLDVVLLSKVGNWQCWLDSFHQKTSTNFCDKHLWQWYSSHDNSFLWPPSENRTLKASPSSAVLNLGEIHGHSLLGGKEDVWV